MFQWGSIPFFRFTFALAAGILFYIHSPYTLPSSILFLCSLFIYLTLFIISSDKNRFYKLKPFLGISAILVLFSFGILLTSARDALNRPDHLLHVKDRVLAYEALVMKNSEERDNTYRTEIEIQKIQTAYGWKSAEGKVLLYCTKKDFKGFIYGDHILVKGTPSPTQAPSNPFEFDHKTYLKYQQIHFAHFIKAGDFYCIDNTPPSYFIASSLFVREKADEVLEQYIPGDSEYKIASALILAIRSTVENELRSAYSSTGTMHVLAVSGLHVGIVAGMIALLLSFLKSFNSGRILFPLAVILTLWFYAFITGFTASVIRAVVMFSLVVLAQSLRRNTNVYNTLSLSAFVLLCLDPFFIMDAGFQLSFLAVLGIVYFQPRIYQLQPVHNYLLDKVWICTSISIAAQIGTLPLCLYYFHQLPLNFILSNLIAIPLSWLLLYLGTLLLLFFWIPGFNHCIGWLTGKGIWCMNQCMLTMEHLPFSVIKRIDIDLPEVLFLYLFIFWLTCFFHTKKLVYLKISALPLMFLCLLQTIEIVQQKNQSGVIAFKVGRHTAVGFIEGDRATVFSDSIVMRAKSKQEYHIDPFFIQHGIDQIDYTEVSVASEALPSLCTDSFSLVCYRGKSYFIEQRAMLTSLPTDYLIPWKKEHALLMEKINIKE